MRIDTPALALIVPLLLSGSLGCRHAAPRAEPSAPATPSAQPPAASPTPKAGHDPAHPPIDCPLRKRGVDPSHLRPFDDVEAYIAFLERPERATWQRPGEVVRALHLAGDETLYDLGAGSGYFAFRFAQALPKGKVIAADIEAEMVRHMHHRAMKEGVSNLEVRLIAPEDPEVPASADLIFICDVLHHVPGREAWLAKVVSGMRTGARLVLIEFKEGDLPEGPPAKVKIPHDEVIHLVTGTGLKLLEDRPDLLPYQTFLVFQKP